MSMYAPAFCEVGSPDKSNGTKMCTREDVLKAIASRPLAFQPWTRPLYSNTGFNLLGWATAQAARDSQKSEAGKTLEELLHDDVFKPLGMKDSFFWVPLDKRENVA